MIRLLKKDEIQKAQNADKNREIQEGLKITKYVDGLRELKSKEEETLQRFREDTLANLNLQIEELEKKRVVAEENLKSIERSLTQQLSKTEQKALNDLKESLESERIALIDRSNELDLQEIDLAVSLKEAEDTLKRRKSQEETTKRLQIEAEEKEKKASDALLRAMGIKNDTERFKEELETTLRLKEEAIKSKEQSIEEKQQEIAEKERVLTAEKVQVADQRKTLERALERIKRNRL